MTLQEKLEIIDRWLLFRRYLIADAKHMTLVDNGVYEFMSPVSGEKGPSELFHIRLEGLSDEDLSNTIREIKEFKGHIQWPYSCSDQMHLAIRGEIPVYPLKDLSLGVMLPDNVPYAPDDSGAFIIKKVSTQDDFALWCDINRFDFGSFHSKNHYHLVIEGKLNCFVGFVDGKHAGIAAILNDDGAAALDFVYVLPEYRNQGLAAAISHRAIDFAREIGLKFIVGWGFPDIVPASYRLFTKLGFPAITSA